MYILGSGDGVLNGEADLDQRWLDGTVEHESMGTRHDNRALVARLADFPTGSFIKKKAPRLDNPLDIRLHGQLWSWAKPTMGLELVGGNKSHLAPLQTTINKGIRLFTGARLSTAIGPLLVETGIGSLLTRSLVSRVRLLERSVTKRTPINAICSGTDNDVFTLNVQGQLVRSQRWFWSRRTKQLYRNRYWLTPQVRPKTVKQRHSFALMETLRTCGDSASLQNSYSAHPLLISWWSVSKYWPSHSVWTSTSNSEIPTQTAGSRTRSGCGECIYLAPRWSLKWRSRSGPALVGRGLWSMNLWGRGMIIGRWQHGLADFLQVAYRQYQSTLWKYHRDRLVEVG
ncbi:hypothetical protein BASA61_009264 [Batrachochytrium salamandrivorans]|nr:hypothetical protein BASA61_009264 [Batrachochytrium salamandrivorans]